ncbi:hypothetical protein BaRGS_00000483, partial [Batillaria attramentaria]
MFCTHLLGGVSLTCQRELAARSSEKSVSRPSRGSTRKHARAQVLGGTIVNVAVVPTLKELTDETRAG